ncbi:probable aminotransferase ACS12 [Dendrobium catenatum]|uniref:Putative aminotransferase ACS12 n=1 Tax=Dendrobium catenatum TaxID=906689 RepID=A0A2I0WBT1_9ASPA|nr:probable aminotransferase ACS12 [Dendrobium catenatum]PKU73118.1 putative aminotransferase ACS12 [Dendrobium catenatum]
MEGRGAPSSTSSREHKFFNRALQNAALMPPSPSPSPLPQMTQYPSRKPASGGNKDDTTSPSISNFVVGSGGTAMRIIVPLQGIVQGRGGLVLGSVIPCALFYLFQLYLRRKRPSSPPSPPPSPSSGELHALPVIPRTHSRNLISPRAGSVPAPLSTRAAVVNKSDACRLAAGHQRYLNDPYHPILNPDGVIQLGLVENQLSLDLVRDWLERNFKALLLEEGLRDLGLGRMETCFQYDGLLDLKMAIADFMGQVLQGYVSFSPSNMILTSGAASAIETLCLCLADPGNAILVPSPYDPGFDKDLKWRTGVDLIPVPCRSTDNFNISISALERAYNQAKKRGVKVRAVLISNPSNPVGNLLRRDALYDLLEFTSEKNIHLISDELYLGSVHGDKTFMSVAEILDTEDFDKCRVHIIYRLSENLSLPGFHVGVIYSLNHNVVAAAAKFTRYSSISILTQRVLVLMLSDKRFISEFLQLIGTTVKNMHHLFAHGLKSLYVNCANGSEGLTCWVDLSKFLRSYSEKGELEMWEKLLDIAKINTTPGSSCHCIEPGWFQFSFKSLSESDIDVVMKRIRRVIEGPEVHNLFDTKS